MKKSTILLILVVFLGIFVGCNEATPAVPLESWQKLYIEYIENIQAAETKISLAYILSGDIPGLIINYPSSAEGGEVVVFDANHNQLVVLEFSLNHIEYIEKQGRIINSDGKMGRYYDKIFQYDNGEFALIFNGLRRESYEALSDSQDEYDVKLQYFVDDEEVTLDEYMRLLRIAEPSAELERNEWGSPYFTDAESVQEYYSIEEIIEIMRSK